MSNAQTRIMSHYIDDAIVATCMDTRLNDEIGIQ